MLAVAFTACSDDDDWAPGEAVEANQVYFLEGSPESVELDFGATNSYLFTLEREDATQAASVPLTVSDPTLFEAPATVEFGAGEKTATATVTFKGTNEAGDYSCTVSIPDGAYNSPYTSLTSSIDIKVSVLKWVLISDNVSITDENGVVPTWYSKLYLREGTNIYRLSDFAKGYDFKFTVDDAGYLYPLNGYYGTYYGYDAWFFSPDGYEVSYPLYLNNDSGMYLDWTLLYTGYQYFYAERKACYLFITGYLYKADAADSNDIAASVNNYFDIYWD
jgi:hypothetical protein